MAVSHKFKVTYIKLAFSALASAVLSGIRRDENYVIF
jgi:hypothetical protein